MLPHRHRVSFQDGVNLAEVEKLIFLQVASLCPHGIQHRSRMTLRMQRFKGYNSNMLVKVCCLRYYSTQYKTQSLYNRITPDLNMEMRKCYLGKDESVIVGVPRIFRSVLHGMKEEHRHDLCHAAT